MASLVNASEFSCSLSVLSTSAVEDHDYWSLNPNVLFGTPVVGVMKFMVAFLLFVIGVFVAAFLISDRRRLRKTHGFPLLLNQTVVVLLHTISLLLFGLVVEFSPQAEFVYGSSDSVRCGMCAFAGFLFVLFNTVLLHTISMSFMVLYDKISRPLRPRLNRKITPIAVIIVWFISFWIAIAPVIGFGSYEFDWNFGACIPAHTGQSKTGVENRAYIAFLFLEGIIPLGFSLYACLATCRIAVKHGRSTRMKNIWNKKVEIQVGADSLKTVQKTLESFISILTFCVLWILLVIGSFAIIATPDLSDEVYTVCWLLYLCNPVFQLLYTILQVRLNF